MKIEIDDDLLDEIVVKRLKEYRQLLIDDLEASEQSKLRVGYYDHNPEIDRAIIRKIIDAYDLLLEYEFYELGNE